MQANQKKVKLIIFSAIMLIAILIISCVALLISITATKNKIERQNVEIEKLNNQIEYYKQLEERDQPDFNLTEEE